jgi:hypothetical protein
LREYLLKLSLYPEKKRPEKRQDRPDNGSGRHYPAIPLPLSGGPEMRRGNQKKQERA